MRNSSPGLVPDFDPSGKSVGSFSRLAANWTNAASTLALSKGSCPRSSACASGVTPSLSGTLTLTLDDYALMTNSVFRVKGVPVMYLPVFYYPIQDDDRATCGRITARLEHRAHQ